MAPYCSRYGLRSFSSNVFGTWPTNSLSASASLSGRGGSTAPPTGNSGTTAPGRGSIRRGREGGRDGEGACVYVCVRRRVRRYDTVQSHTDTTHTASEAAPVHTISCAAGSKRKKEEDEETAGEPHTS